MSTLIIQKILKSIRTLKIKDTQAKKNDNTAALINKSFTLANLCLFIFLNL